MTEFQSEPLAVVKQVHETGRPVVVTNEGKADVVIMDAATFERHLKLANLSRLLAEGEAAVRAGKTISAREFFDGNRRDKKVSG